MSTSIEDYRQISEDQEDWVPPTHPGEVLDEEVLAPLGLSAYRLARDIGVPLTRVAAILKGGRSVSPDTALRLGAYTATAPEFWLNLGCSSQRGRQ